MTQNDFEDFYAQMYDSAEEQPMTPNQHAYIEDLMDQVQLTDEELDGIKLMFAHSVSMYDAGRLITMLEDRLPDPVTERGNYTQSELNAHIRKISGI